MTALLARQIATVSQVILQSRNLDHRHITFSNPCFFESRFQEFGPTSLVAGRVDVLVLERVLKIDRDVHAGDLGSPEEIPVFFDLE